MGTEQRCVDAMPLPEHLAAEPWSPESAAWRLELLRPALDFTVPSSAEFRGGNSNDAWVWDERILRICWRADRDRLIREAHVLQELPDQIPHASVDQFGSCDGLSWVLSPLIDGTPLVQLQDPALFRSVFSELAIALRELHEWTPSDASAELIAARPAADRGDEMAVWAADLLPLPLERLAAVETLARREPHVDGGLIDTAVDRIRSLASHDPFASDDAHVVVHGDATMANLLVRDGHLVALIDFEYVRIGPRDLELLSPVLYQRGYGVNWLREDYPELFAARDLRERLWLYELCAALRGVVWWPPTDANPEHPPLRILRSLIERPTSW